MMTYEMEMIYQMTSKIMEMTEEEFLQDVFCEYQGVRISCDDADIIAKMDGAIDDQEECTIYWQGMVITYDPYEDWGAEEL